MDTNFILWIITQYTTCCSNCSSFGHWALFQLVPVSLWHILIFMGFSFYYVCVYLLIYLIHHLPQA